MPFWQCFYGSLSIWHVNVAECSQSEYVILAGPKSQVLFWQNEKYFWQLGLLVWQWLPKNNCQNINFRAWQKYLSWFMSIGTLFKKPDLPLWQLLTNQARVPNFYACHFDKKNPAISGRIKNYFLRKIRTSAKIIIAIDITPLRLEILLLPILANYSPNRIVPKIPPPFASHRVTSNLELRWKLASRLLG